MGYAESWTGLTPLEIIRLLLPTGFLVLSVLLPGRRATRLAAFGVALGVAMLPELFAFPWLAPAWAGLWLMVAILAGTGPAPTQRWSQAVPWFEASMVGAVLVSGLLLLLFVSISRQDVSDPLARRAGIGIVALGLGLLHLVVRLNIRRSIVAWAAIGLGLELLTGAAEEVLFQERIAPPGTVLLATAISLALVTRIAMTRLGIGAGGRVSEAHDLHD